MALGTAGYTAALAVAALEDWGRDQDGRSPGSGHGGPAGGVGSVAVALLASPATPSPRPRDGRKRVTISSRSGQARRSTAPRFSKKADPLQKERWAVPSDSVGSVTLANVLAQTAYGGAVAACGLAGGADHPATVMPHICAASRFSYRFGDGAAGEAGAGLGLLAESFDRRHFDSMVRIEPLSRIEALAERSSMADSGAAW